jgi:hypothetical protein
LIGKDIKEAVVAFAKFVSEMERKTTKPGNQHGQQLDRSCLTQVQTTTAKST